MAWGRRLRKGSNAPPDYIGGSAAAQELGVSSRPTPNGHQYQEQEQCPIHEPNGESPRQNEEETVFGVPKPNADPQFTSVVEQYEAAHPDIGANKSSTVTEQYEKNNPNFLHLPGFTNAIALPFPQDMPSRLETATELSQRDPDELIPIPMLHTTQPFSLRYYNPFSSSTPRRETTIIIRPMRRGLYRKKYAKDRNGDYIGTGKPAPDQGLVFVPDRVYEKGAVERDVGRVAFGRQHWQHDFPTTHSGGGGA